MEIEESGDGVEHEYMVDSRDGERREEVDWFGKLQGI